MGLFGFIGKLLGLGGSAPQKIDISKVSASAGLPIVYGRRKAKPITVFKVVSQKNMPSSGAGYDDVVNNYSGDKDKNQKSNDWLHRIDVWGQGKVSDIERFWIDGDAHTSKRFLGRPYFRALSKFGDENQLAANELAIGHSDWTGAHRGQGVAYTWSRFYNSGKEPQFEGEPRLEALVVGLKCYDPRLAVPEFTQEFDNPDTWTHTENRALVVLNYLMGNFGFNAREEELDIPSFIKAADQCDEKVTIPVPAVNAGPSIPEYWNCELGEYVEVGHGVRYPCYRPWQGPTETEQAKYAVGAVLDPKDGVVKNTKLLLEGMGWALPWSNGKHKLIIEGEVEGPVMHFDADSIMGGWNVERGMRADRLNRVTIEFPNANKQYQDDTVSWPAIGSEEHLAFKAEDQNQDLHTNKSAETITDFYRAQAYAEYLVRKSRVNPRIKGLKLSPKAMLLEPGDVISIYYEDKGFGRESKADGTEYEGTLFIVERVDVSSFLDVRVDLIKYDPTVYGAPALEQEPIPNSPYNPDWWRQAPAPTDLVLDEVDEVNADGTVIRGIKATWVLPEGLNGISSVEVEWKKSSAPEYGERMTLAAGSEEALIMGALNDAVGYDVRVRYVTQRSQKSASAEASITMTVVQSVVDLLADGQLVFADFWDFGPTAKGWTADQAVLDEGDNAIDFHTTGVDAKLISPAGLRIDGSKWDKVIVRLKRQSVGDGQKWEQAYLYYNTTSRGGFDQRFREFSNARYVVGRYVTFVFDMNELSSSSLNPAEKQDWITSVITQLRFDPTITANDHLTIDWIGLGRAAPSISAAHGQNLVSDLGFKKFDAADTNVDSNFTAKTLEAMNLSVGDAISAGIEVITSGVRRGRLRLEFLNVNDSAAETQYSPWSSVVGAYEQVKLEALYIPEGTVRIRAWLEREDAGSGSVGARYYTLNAGSAVVRYAPVRDDVQEGATHNNIQIFRQDNAPPILDLSEGSVWFDTNDTTLYVLKDGAWTLSATENHISSQSSAPNGTKGDIWYNPSNKKLYRHTGYGWDEVSNNITDTRDLYDGARLGETADWDRVSGSGKPDDYATRNTGALADLNETQTTHIANGAVSNTGWQVSTSGSYLTSSWKGLGSVNVSGFDTSTDLAIVNAVATLAFDGRYVGVNCRIRNGRGNTFDGGYVKYNGLEGGDRGERFVTVAATAAFRGGYGPYSVEFKLHGTPSGTAKYNQVRIGVQVLKR
ncbi:MAG: phage tail protein [Kordiimonas sp.]